MSLISKRKFDALCGPLALTASRLGIRPVHILHVGKTGGTALKETLTPGRFPLRRIGRNVVFFRPHEIGLVAVPKGQKLIIGLRNPVKRFVSAFYSRKRGGRFGKVRDLPHEREAFALFETPNELALALTSNDQFLRSAAESAMNNITHLKSHLSNWLSSADYIQERKEDFLYVYQQESLEQDFRRMSEILSCPPSYRLPLDALKSHRHVSSANRELDGVAVENIRRWYAEDYMLIDACATLFCGDGLMSSVTYDCNPGWSAHPAESVHSK